jgi:transcriptional regulator with XRE-family HTH domain
VETIEEVLELARLSRVTITEACKHSRVSNNTVSRWRNGVQPRPAKFFAFRNEVINVAWAYNAFPNTGFQEAHDLGVRKLLELMK